jgi:hypothetical protein
MQLSAPICSAIFARILPWIEPTRYDKTLKQFANYHELWAPNVGGKGRWGVKPLAGSTVQWAMGALKAQSQRLLSTKASGG